MGNRIVKIKLMESDSLQHYGVKGMVWGKIKKEDLSLPFKLSEDLPKVQPRAYQNTKNEQRVTQEVRDDSQNRITNFDKVPRFNPKNESINTAFRKVNEGYEYTPLVDGQMARDYGLYDSDGNIKHFANNCPSATFAYELRRRGLDVEAGLTGGAAVKTILEAFNINDEELKKIEKENSIPPKTINDLEDIMKAMGPGARGFCIMNWGNGFGHINAFEINEKGEIVYIDAQTGISSKDKLSLGADNPADYHKKAEHYFVVRTDNRKMNPTILKDWVRVDDRIEPNDVDRVKNVDNMNIKRKKVEQVTKNYDLDRKEYLVDAKKKQKKTEQKTIKKKTSLINSGKKIVDKLLRKD